MSNNNLKPYLRKWDLEGNLKEYVVLLTPGEDYNTFWQQMEWKTDGLPFIPDRQVEIANDRSLNERSCHYVLTDEEAAKLKNDSRIHYIGLPPEHRTDVNFEHAIVQNGNFVIPNYLDSTGNIVNWGLVRHSRINDTYLGNISPSSNTYNYTYDGTGVDVVIQDSGIHAAHPEWEDANGNSRLQQIDWWVATGQAITPNLKVWPNVSIHGDNSIRTSNSTSFYGYYDGMGEPALVMGGGISMVNRLGYGPEDSNKSFRLRSEGATITTDSYTANTLVWELRFLNNGWIEMLVANANIGVWGDQARTFGLTSASGGYLAGANAEPWFASPIWRTANAAPRSLVLTRPDPHSTTWSINAGNGYANYHAELVGNDWTLVSGVAPIKGFASLYRPTISNGYLFVTENLRFNTTFDFDFPLTKDLSPSFYQDRSGHGTHVAGIVAGKTYGWAKNANIYSHKLQSLSSGSAGGLSNAESFDILKRWHNLKPVDPVTGFKRPTIINASWVSVGTTINYANVQGVVYRGNTFIYDANITNSFEFGINTTNPVPTISFYPLIREEATDAALEDALTAQGLIYIHAGGNNDDYHDKPGGPDYNNYIITNTYEGNVYYSRGTSPTSTNVINVGSVDTFNGVQPIPIYYDILTGGNLNLKATYSAAGRYIDVWAAGTMIMSATSNLHIDLNTYGTYYANPSFKQSAITGTSMAAPQVAGIGALFLQVNPGANFAQFKEWLSNAGSVSNVIFNYGYDQAFDRPYISSQSGNFANTRAGYGRRNLLGAPNKLVYSGNIYPIAGIASLVYSGNNNSNITTAPSFSFGGPISFKNINIRFA